MNIETIAKIFKLNFRDIFQSTKVHKEMSSCRRHRAADPLHKGALCWFTKATQGPSAAPWPRRIQDLDYAEGPLCGAARFLFRRKPGEVILIRRTLTQETNVCVQCEIN